ncbi:MAG TPA: hypothetical protein VLW26_07450 [Steroidobacteraceae bacterium]|nr:hypothetical protein [Steroidobacteraceae bacterium]
MIAQSEVRDSDHPAWLHSPALAVPLGFIALIGFMGMLDAATKLVVTRSSSGVWDAEQWLSLAAHLLIAAAAAWWLLGLQQTRLKRAVLTVLLLVLGLQGVVGTTALMKVVLATHTFWRPWGWQLKVFLAQNLLCFAGATPGSLALFLATFSKEHPFAIFSNSPVPLAIALFAIASWLIGMAINKGWWYFSADEHDRRADDVGNLAGWALFVILTPAWWVAARAGLMPQPDAMILWIAAVTVSAIGYFWRKNR